MATLTAPRLAVHAVRTQPLPWYLWCGALAVTSASVGAYWDVSWHRSIGRDTFWTPAHMAIYLCGVLAAVCCGYLILTTTILRPRQMVASSVNVLGFRAPLGAFVAAWGGIAMLTSAPFDNWWHNAYGLDVKIISPPHTLLIIGSWAVSVGTLFLIVAEMNRAGKESALTAAEQSERFQRLQGLVLYLAGIMLVSSMFFRTEYTSATHLHGSVPYISIALGTPLYLAAVRVVSRNRWASTWMAVLYTVFVIGFILILPLFPAEPKLGPVFQHVTHFVPPSFPLLIIVPAIAMDLLLGRTANLDRFQSTGRVTTWKPLLASLIAGPLFVLSLVAVQWPFASFLMTKASQNRFFATGYYSYDTPPWSSGVLHQFVFTQHGLDLWKGLSMAMVYAAISTYLGLLLGRWMQKIQR